MTTFELFGILLIGLGFIIVLPIFIIWIIRGD